MGVCCGGSTPTPPAPAAGYACSGPGFHVNSFASYHLPTVLVSPLGVCCGGSTPTPPAPAAGYACSGPGFHVHSFASYHPHTVCARPRDGLQPLSCPASSPCHRPASRLDKHTSKRRPAAFVRGSLSGAAHTKHEMMRGREAGRGGTPRGLTNLQPVRVRVQRVTRTRIMK